MSTKSSPTRTRGARVHKTKLDYNDPMLLLEIEGLARDGYDDQQIAMLLDIAPETFSRHKNKKVDIAPENVRGISQLSQALTRGRRPLNVLVENSMYKRAIGQKVVTTKVITKREFNQALGHFETNIYDETITTELPGDVGAQIFWLRNHKPDVYNQQPAKIDLTSGGKEIKNETPRIAVIEHITITDHEINKTIELN